MCRTLVTGFLLFYLTSCGGLPSSNSSSKPNSSITLTAAQNPSGIQPSFFGFHINHLGTGTPWPSVPFGTWDLWDAGVQWPTLEPQRGIWDFSRLDSYVALAHEHGVDLIYTLGLTPQWASARPSEPCPYGPGEAAEPANLQDWRDYVRTISTRYKGKIKYYILWNEPNLPYYFTGSTDTLLELSKEAYDTLKSVDPSIVVLSPAGFRVAGADSFLSKGGGQYFEVLAAHLYTYPNPPEHTIGDIQKISDALLHYGLSNVPIWDTEIGWYHQSLSDHDSVAYLSRAMILNAASGMGRFIWYAWDNHSWAKIWLTQVDSETLTPTGVAFGEVEKWLTYRTLRCQSSAINSNEQLWTCSLTSPDGFMGHIVWTTSGTSEFQIPASWKASTERKPDGTSALLDSDSYTVSPTPTLFDNAPP